MKLTLNNKKYASSILVDPTYFLYDFHTDSASRAKYFFTPSVWSTSLQACKKSFILLTYTYLLIFCSKVPHSKNTIFKMESKLL